MTKGFIRLFTTLLLAFYALNILAIEKDTDGTYFISSDSDLKEFADLVNNGTYGANAILTADVDISSYSPWTPIGTKKSYNGTFDGQGHSVSGLTIQKNVDSNLGLFGINNGTIKNVTVKEANIKVSTALAVVKQGAITGENKGSIINCHSVNSTIDNFSTGMASKAGGIAGVNSGTIDGCSNIGGVCIVRSLSEVVGGICGTNSGTIKSCENTARVENSYSAGSLTNYTGGICGNADNGTIENCFNGGEVEVKSGNGGAIAATTNDNSKIKDCAWDNTVTDQKGVGNNKGTIENTNGYTKEEIEKGAIEKDSTGSIVVKHTVNKYDYCSAYGTPEKVYGDKDIFNPDNHCCIEITTEAVEPTCHSEGHTAGSRCSGCGMVLQTSNVLAKLQHKESVLSAVEATCKAAGHTTGTFCSLCGDTLVMPDFVPQLDHKSDTIKGVKPTCQTMGLTDHIYCRVCNTVLQTPDTLPMLAHDIDTIPATMSTCSSHGTTAWMKCRVCNDTLKHPTYTEKLQHTADTLVAITPTCNSFGWSVGVNCKVCGDTIVARTKIAKLEHVAVIDSGIPASCNKLGKTNGSHCELCGDVIVMQTIIGLQPHDSVEIIPAVEPGCVSPGYTAKIVCSVCDKLIQDVEMTPSLGGHVCEVFGHIEPTDSTFGFTGDSICIVCHDTLQRGYQYGGVGVDEFIANNIQVLSSGGKIIIVNAPFETIEIYSVSGNRIITSKSVSIKHEIAVRRQQVYLVKVRNRVFKVMTK